MNRTLLIFTISLLLSAVVFADKGNQVCSPPILSNFSNPSLDGFTLNWIDFNDNAISWDLEIIEKGLNPSGIPTELDISEKSYTVSDLLSGKAYDVYLRSKCLDGESNWNGPYSYNTMIDNSLGCNLSLAITDDNCPEQDSFYIWIEGIQEMMLGTDVQLSSVYLIIEHQWVADLSIYLESPSGQKVKLTEHHGIGKQNYGDPNQLNCLNSIEFNDQACNFVLENNYPYVGLFKPEESFQNFNDNSSPNGQWKLLICDRVEGDIGLLNYIHIEFYQNICVLPNSVSISDFSENSIAVEWSSSSICDSIIIEYGPSGFIPGEGTLLSFDCASLEAQINNLPNAFNGDLYYGVFCSSGNLMSPCPLNFTTHCAPVSLITDFNELDICQPGCNNTCPLDSIWYNEDNDDQNWYVYEGKTNTDFTGPDAGFLGAGNYIYIESSQVNCQQNAVAHLRSKCILIPENSDVCSFSYMAFLKGEGIQKLRLEISTDGGFEWSLLDELIGEQSSNWTKRTIDLSDYSGKKSTLRFSGFGGFNQFGDIALDHLTFHGAELFDPNCYYADNDNDGYGSPSEESCFCSDSPPTGFSANNLDCDDLAFLINPEAIEIPCNLIDENCNGNIDDHEGQDIIEITVEDTEQATCDGSADGSIQISISGGQSPFDVLWSHGDTGITIQSLETGYYSGTITDASFCQTIIDSVFIDFNLMMDVDIVALTTPFCQGVEDGSIEVEVSGGSAPYSYLWNTGAEEQILDSITSGTYTVSIMDQNGCSAASDSFHFSAPNPITAGIQLSTDPFCYGSSEGYIVLGAIGGQAPYEFLWDDGSDQNIRQNLAAGFYSCTVSDQQGCIFVLENMTLNEPEALEVFIDAVDASICHGESNGSIELSVMGGTAPYSFFWSNGAITDDIFNLNAGAYSVTVYDSKACQSSIENIEVQESDPITITPLQLKQASCPGAADGQIIIDVTGGGGDYNYYWSNGWVGTDTLNDVMVGDYNIVVVDQYGCKSRYDDLEIASLNLPLNIQVDEIIQNLCFGDTTGSISISINDASLPIDINWSTGEKEEINQLTDKLEHLAAGSYQVTVTDHIGCVGISENIELLAQVPLEFELASLSDVSCFGFSDGTIDVFVDGGNPPYTYFWDNGVQDSIVTNLFPGQYKLLIIDANSCVQFTPEYTINEPEKLLAESSSQAAINGMANGIATVIPIGGSAPYTALWDNNANDQTTFTAINLFPGSYSVTLTDTNLCVYDTIIQVDNIMNTVNYEFEDVYVYPNPVSEVLHINPMNFPSDFTIQIFNTNGAMINQFNHVDLIESNLWLTAQIDVSNYEAGLYVLRMVSNTGSAAIIRSFVITP